ncbi:MAG: phosphoethanolamine transferase, partial [Hydrogenophaga sp.]|nr:phosphoethanolamine transferase [Hydrogenophaga sp.]
IAGLLAWMRRPRWVLFLLLPFYFLLPAEILYIIQYGGPSDSHVLGVLLETSLTETVGYIGWGTIVLVLGCSFTFVCAVFFSFKYVPEQVSQHRAWSWLRGISVLVFLSMCWFAWNDPYDTYEPSQSDKSSVSRSSAQVAEALFLGGARPLDELYGGSFPIGIPLRAWVFSQELNHLRRLAERIAYVPSPQVRVTWPAQSAELTQPSTVVLVIGESSRPDHWSINGYERNTTPALGSQNGIVSFQNVVTPWPATRRAVPILLIGEMEQTHLASINHPSVLRIFKQAGYRTTWLSNQSPLGPYDSLIAIHARQADEVIYTNRASYSKAGALDEALLLPLAETLRGKVEKNFVVLHLLGSHKRYVDRYPLDFGQFKPTIRDGVDDDNSTVNAYDNSIAYTDYVLSNIIKLLETQSKRLCCTTQKRNELTPTPDAAMPWRPRAPLSGARAA